MWIPYIGRCIPIDTVAPTNGDRILHAPAGLSCLLRAFDGLTARNAAIALCAVAAAIRTAVRISAPVSVSALIGAFCCMAHYLLAVASNARK
jgi:hypothetical protein